MDKVSNIVKRFEKSKDKEVFDKDGKVKISRIFNELNFEISYDDIRLALVFL